MINFYETVFLLKFPIILLIISYFILFINWDLIFRSFKLAKYNKIQRVHLNEIPRLGGLLIVIVYFFYICAMDFNNDNFFILLVLSFLPTLLISLKEDLFFNTKTSSRVIAMTLSCLIYFLVASIKFPIIDLPIVNYILQNELIEYLFFIFSVLIIMNGNNMIDGANGLMSFSILSQLIGIFYLAVEVGDITIQLYSLLLFFPVIIFLIFNYPLGKIFMGDLGTFFLGFYISILILMLFSQYPEIPSWNAVLILFYPSMEVLYSFYRKFFIARINPMISDKKHLHSIIFCYGVNKKIDEKKMNNLVALILCPFWLAPILMTQFYNNLSLIYLCLFILFLLYIVTYNVVTKKLKNIN